jgi:hypothetical protein
LLQKNSFIGLANGGKSYVLLSLLQGENGLNYDFFPLLNFETNSIQSGNGFPEWAQLVV